MRARAGYRVRMERAADWPSAIVPGRRVGHAIEVHERIGSTNDRARDLLALLGGPGTAVVAEEQVAGRGRRGRTWASPPGVNLYVSVGILPRLAAGDAWQLGLAVALAVRDACLPVAGVELKWPNDLVAPDGRKLGGILVETAVDGERLDSAVIGIGINANWTAADMPAELLATATSLRELAGTLVDRVGLLGRLLARLDAELVGLERGESPLERYRAACSTLGADVSVATAGTTIVGRAVDLDASGALVVATAEGPMTIGSGEVTRLRPAVPA